MRAIPWDLLAAKGLLFLWAVGTTICLALLGYYLLELVARRRA